MAKNDLLKHNSERNHSLNGANEKPVDQIRDTVNDSLLQNNNMLSQEIRSIASSAMGLISKGDLHLVTNGEVGYVLEKPYDSNKSSMYKLVLFWGYLENGQHNKNYVIDCEEEYIYDIEANFSKIAQFSTNYQDIAQAIKNLLVALKNGQGEFEMSRYDANSYNADSIDRTKIKIERSNSSFKVY